MIFPCLKDTFLICTAKKVPPGILTLAELRWSVFSKKQADSEKLPPTLATLGEKVNQAHYISLPWKTSHVSNLSLLDPIGYRWYCNTNERIFEPVMTKLAPSPGSKFQLIICNYKTKCVTSWCKCRKNRLNCNEMCDCENGENDEKDENMFLDCRSGDDGAGFYLLKLLEQVSYSVSSRFRILVLCEAVPKYFSCARHFLDEFSL